MYVSTNFCAGQNVIWGALLLSWVSLATWWWLSLAFFSENLAQLILTKYCRGSAISEISSCELQCIVLRHRQYLSQPYLKEWICEYMLVSRWGKTMLLSGDHISWSLLACCLNICILNKVTSSALQLSALQDQQWRPGHSAVVVSRASIVLSAANLNICFKEAE